MYKEKTIKAGAFIEKERYSPKSKRFEYYIKHGVRPPKDNTKRSTMELKKSNYKRAEKRLRRLMHANFTPKDFHVTLTLDEKLDNDGKSIRLDEKLVKRSVVNFLRRIKGYFKTLNRELKYIYCIGQDKKNGIHAHIIMSGMSFDKVAEIWKKDKNAGRIDISQLYFDKLRGLAGLAYYFMKNSLERDREIKNKNLEEYNKLLLRKYNPSKNLEQPQEDTKIIYSLKIKDDPKEYKNCTITEVENKSVSYGFYQYIQMVNIKKFDKMIKKARFRE